jgi:hypothetical protein
VEVSKACRRHGGAPFHIYLLHINDTYGHTRSFKADKSHHLAGGYGRLATLVGQRRKHTHGPGRVLFIHSGDELGQCDELTCKSIVPRAVSGVAVARPVSDQTCRDGKTTGSY